MSYSTPSSGHPNSDNHHNHSDGSDDDSHPGDPSTTTSAADRDDGTMSEVSVKTSRTRESERGKGTLRRRHSLDSNGDYVAKSQEIIRNQQVVGQVTSLLILPSPSPRQLSQTRARGLIWWKSLLSLGGDGKFHSRFAVIEKGLLTFYRNEEVI
jgi:hypothetical protein